jgi:hypothetical protein
MSSDKFKGVFLEIKKESEVYAESEFLMENKFLQHP